MSCRYNLRHRGTPITSNTQFIQPNASTPPAPMRHPLPGTLPGAATYVVLAIWAAAVGYRASPRFRNYLLSLDLRLLLAAQLWRVIGIAFLFALAFGKLPAGFAVPAGIGDLATGIAALAVVLALGNGTLTRGRLYA